MIELGLKKFCFSNVFTISRFFKMYICLYQLLQQTVDTLGQVTCFLWTPKTWDYKNVLITHLHTETNADDLRERKKLPSSLFTSLTPWKPHLKGGGLNKPGAARKYLSSLDTLKREELCQSLESGLHDHFHSTAIWLWPKKVAEIPQLGLFYLR